MQELTVDPLLGEKLSQLVDRAVFCDFEGRVLGLFQPFHDRPKLEDFRLEPLCSNEDRGRQNRETTGKPLEEILNRLGIH